jgi:glutamate decarboxylase
MPLNRSSTTAIGIDATPQLSVIPLFSRSAEPTTVLRHRLPNGLRERGRQVPAYTFPANREDLAALRVVVRNGSGRELSDLLLDDLAHLLPPLQRQAAPARGTAARGLDHATAQRKS